MKKPKEPYEDSRVLKHILESVMYRLNTLERESSERKHKDLKKRINSMTLEEKVNFVKTHGKEAFIEFIIEGKKPVVKEKRKHKQIEGVREYLETCKKLNKHEPTLEELQKHSNISKSTWYRKLKDAIFLTELYRRCEERINRSNRNENNREFWVHCSAIILNRLNKLTRRNRKNDIQHDENINQDAVDEFTSDRYSE
jgi:hypothetical protein